MPQQNPYAQQPAGYGYPATGPGAHGAPTMPGGVPVGAPGGYGSGPGGAGGSGSSGGKGLPSWLWAVGGAVAASAVWAGVLFPTGGLSGEPDPDLRGYSYRTDLCGATSWTPFEDARFRMEDSSTSSSAAENPEASGAQDAALDSMWCNADLVSEDAGSDDYSSTFVYTKAFLHKKTDPAPEFAAQYRSYEQQGSNDYKVTPVQGIGDEAYLVSRDESPDSKSTYVVLGVRDGWLTYETTWSSYAGSSDTTDHPTSDEAAAMLRTSATQTLQKLKN